MVWRVHTKSCFRLLIMTKKLPPVFLIETKPCQHFSCVNYNFWQYYPELPSWGLQCDDNNIFNVLYSGCSCSIMTPTNGIWKEKKKVTSRFIFICLVDNQYPTLIWDIYYNNIWLILNENERFTYDRDSSLPRCWSTLPVVVTVYTMA